MKYRLVEHRINDELQHFTIDKVNEKTIMREYTVLGPLNRIIVPMASEGDKEFRKRAEVWFGTYMQTLRRPKPVHTSKVIKEEDFQIDNPSKD